MSHSKFSNVEKSRFPANAVLPVSSSFPSRPLWTDSDAPFGLIFLVVPFGLTPVSRLVPRDCPVQIGSRVRFTGPTLLIRTKKTFRSDLSVPHCSRAVILILNHAFGFMLYSQCVRYVAITGGSSIPNFAAPPYKLLPQQ